MTPTCRTCGTKFPGRDVCKQCGADPAAAPTVESRIGRALRESGVPKNMDRIVSGTVRVSASYAKTKAAFTTISALLADPSMRAYERRVLKARVRSIKSNPPKRKHGRPV